MAPSYSAEPLANSGFHWHEGNAPDCETNKSFSPELRADTAANVVARERRPGLLAFAVGLVASCAGLLDLD